MSKIVDVPDDILKSMEEEDSKIRWNILEENKTRGDEWTKSYYELYNLKYVENYPQNAKCPLCGFKFRQQEDPVDHLIPCIKLYNTVNGRHEKKVEETNNNKHESEGIFFEVPSQKNTVHKDNNLFLEFLTQLDLEASNIEDILIEMNLRKLFRFYDKDNSGEIDKKEFKKLLSDIDSALLGRFEDVTKMLSEETKIKLDPLLGIKEKFDELKENPIDEVDSTFRKGVEEVKKKLKKDDVSYEFETMDINGDGKLDFYEFSLGIRSWFVYYTDLVKSIKAPLEKVMKDLDLGDFGLLSSMMNSKIHLPKEYDEILEFNSNHCTRVETGKNYYMQDYYVCHTCGYDYVGCTICESCIHICHKEHQVEKLGKMRCYCDDPDLGNCRAIHNK